MENRELASAVTISEEFDYPAATGGAQHHIVAYDFGVKTNSLREFSKLGCRVTVVPADTSLQSLLGTVAPGASVSGAGGSVGGSTASTSNLRSDLPGPAFELKGCTSTQDEVARLIENNRVGHHRLPTPSFRARTHSASPESMNTALK